MLKKLAELQKEKDSILAEMETLISSEEALSEEQQAEFDAKKASVEALKKKIELQSYLVEQKRNQPIVTDLNSPTQQEQAELTEGFGVDTSIKIPARCKRWSGNLMAFKGPKADETAYLAGMWFRALHGSLKARKYCADRGWGLQNWDLDIGALYQEDVNTTGGYLVPEELDRVIIDLVLEYGVFRRYARISPMMSDTKLRSRRTGGLTSYFIGEGSSGTESTGSWDQVSLIAKKQMVLTRITNELNSDAIINVADNVVMEIARAFAYKEDLCGFLGDGTSTYGGITGAATRLTDTFTSTTADSVGVEIATGNLMTEVTLGDLDGCASKLPSYARPGAAWFCSPTCADKVFGRLQRAAGGVSPADLVNGTINRYAGYPIVLTEVLPSTDTNSQILAILGDLRLAADFGDRQGITIAFSDSAYIGSTSVFETDEIGVRGTSRFDINVHDYGSSSAAGPIVGLRALNA